MDPNIGNKSSSGNSNNNSLVVTIVPFGPSVKNINSFTSKLINRPKVRTYLQVYAEMKEENDYSTIKQ
jgi:hypothetical protein